MKKLLAFTALVEAITGVALVVTPALVVRLLLGAELLGVAYPAARIAGIALISLGIACWPGKSPTRAALGGMTTYNLLITLYLISLGLQGEWVGPLLWPGTALHTVLTLLLGAALFKIINRNIIIRKTTFPISPPSSAD